MRNKSKNFSIHNTFYYPETDDSTKEFVYGKKKLVGEDIQYNDQVVFCELRIGDFFGGKSKLTIIQVFCLIFKKIRKSKSLNTSIQA